MGFLLCDRLDTQFSADSYDFFDRIGTWIRLPPFPE